MKRKILSALLCVAMTATMLAGCGNKSNESTDDKNQEATDDAAADDAADDATDDAAGDDAADDSAAGGDKLTVWCWDRHSTFSPWKRLARFIRLTIRISP